MTRPKALGAYIFAGGFTVGVREHFDVTDHLEGAKPYGAATAERNLGVKVHRGPASAWPLKDFADVPFIFGNPPCAAWSLAGAQLGSSKADTWRSDARVDCTREHFGLLEALRPRVWVWESVSQAFIAGREFVDELAGRAMDMGYSATAYLHDAQWLGVPHRRKRFMLICHDVELDLPPPATWESETISQALRKINDPGELHASAATYQKSYGWLLPHASGTTDLSKVFNSVMGDDAPRNAQGNVAGRPSFLLRRDEPDRVAATLMHERVHPTEDRFLTLRELTHLCGFPPSWDPNVKDSHELFRGVMPPVAEHVAACAADAIRRDRRVTMPTYRLVDQLKAPGRVEPLSISSPAGRPAGRAAHTKPDDAECGARAPTATAVDPVREGVVPPAAALPRDVRPKAGLGSGAYIRLLIHMGYGTNQILEMNLRHFPGSRATTADVSWNKKKLRELQGNGASAITAGPAPAAQVQLTRKRTPDTTREYDTSALTEKSHGYRVHRDYAAHFFRWGFVWRQLGQRSGPVLEVGCGEDTPFVKLVNYGDQVPERYVGVDLNPLPPSNGWREFRGSFNFNERHAELGSDFAAVLCLEVIEHMTRTHGDELLAGIRACLRPGGRAYLSTPVFNGRAAANHIHEYGIEELREAVENAGFRVVRRFGTFASYNDIVKVCTPEQRVTLDGLNEFYSSDVTACFLAPLYPDASRNDLWVLEHA